MHNTNRQKGFTLVEILVIAPIIVIMIAVLISTMVLMVGELLIAKEENRLSLEISSALQSIDKDVRMSPQILSTTPVPMPSPMGSNNGTASFTTSADSTNPSATLITSQLGLTDKPESPDRKLIYYQTQPTKMTSCNARSITNNNLYKVSVVYFVKNQSLYKRTILPDYNVANGTTPNASTICNTPWQKNTCTNSASSTSDKCYVNDSELIKDVKSFSLKYFLEPTSNTPITQNNQIDKAKAVEITIKTQTTVAGKDVGRSSTIRSTTINAK